MALLFFGPQIFVKLGRDIPMFFVNLETKKKFMYMFIIFYLSGTIQSFVTNSNAFEVYFNNALIYSKLQNGGFPEPFMIENILQNFFNK